MAGVKSVAVGLTRVAFLICVTLLATGCTAETSVPEPSTVPPVATPSSIPSIEPTASPAETAPEIDPAMLAFAEQLFAAANAARTAEGLNPLQPSDCAHDFAESRNAVLLGQPLEHDPQSMFALSQSCALAGGMTGENLVRGVGTPEEFVTAWLDSPGHRANLLNPDFQEAALACVADSEFDDTDAILCTHLFLG